LRSLISTVSLIRSMAVSLVSGTAVYRD